MIQDILLKLNWPGWLFALTAIVLAGVAYIYYHRTLPPLSPARRIILRLLRGAILLIILFLLLEPLLRISVSRTEPPVVAVLADVSASMAIEDGGGPRHEELESVLASLSGLSGADSVRFAPFRFDLDVHPDDGAAPDYSADGTNLARAIAGMTDSLAGSNLQAAILISDGVYNQGANPVSAVRAARIPVFTVTVGDTGTPRDIAIRRVEASSVSYVDQETPVEVVLFQNGFADRDVVVTARWDGRELARQAVRLGNSGLEQKVTLDLVPNRAGDAPLDVAVQVLDGEITANNNRQTSRLQVLKRKVRVLVMVGAPDFDRHFLSIVADQLPDIDLVFRTTRADGGYYEGAFSDIATDSIDAVVMHGYPSRNVAAPDLRRLMESVERRRLPLLWFINRRTQLPALSPWREWLPMETLGALNAINNRVVRLTQGGQRHPVLRLDESETANALLWRELPPLQAFAPLNPREGSRILLGFQDSETIPACFVYRQREIKHLVFNGANWGNWHFQLQQDPSRERFLIDLVDRMIRWAVNRDDINQIQVRPVQELFNVGEPVAFSGQVFDGFYQPLADAQVQVTVRGDSLEWQDELASEGRGFYRQVFSGLPAGEFEYTVTAERNGEPVGSRRGRFTVQPFYLEYQQVAADAGLMAQLARESGGAAYDVAGFRSRFSLRGLDARVQLTANELYLWNSWWWLVGLVVLLGTEWLLRKRWGLL